MSFEQKFNISKMICVIVETLLYRSSLLNVAYELFVANVCLTETLNVAVI